MACTLLRELSMTQIGHYQSKTRTNLIRKVTPWLQRKDRIPVRKRTGSFCSPPDSQCPEPNIDAQPGVGFMRPFLVVDRANALGIARIESSNAKPGLPEARPMGFSQRFVDKTDFVVIDGATRVTNIVESASRQQEKRDSKSRCHHEGVSGPRNIASAMIDDQ